jgi:hypothetical protein
MDDRRLEIQLASPVMAFDLHQWLLFFPVTQADLAFGVAATPL